MGTDTAVDTYRYLRGGILVMLFMLFVALLVERARATGWLGSVSAYYFTGAHGVFIGSICAMGALLIVYQGAKPTEDVLLNLAGVLAFVVAFVPTTRPETRVSITVPAADLVANAWALVAAVVVARVGSWVLHRRTGTAPRREPIARIVVAVQWVLLTVGVATLASAPRWFVAHAHGVAAVVLFVAIIATVFTSAFLADTGVIHSSNPIVYQRLYRVIAVLMLVTLATSVAAHFAVAGPNTVVLGVESALLVEFGAYWVVQTAERWGGAGGAVEPSCTGRRRRILDAL